MSHLLLAGLTFAVMPTKLAAAAPSEGGFSISLHVPTVCDIDAGDFQVDASRSEITGQVYEYCNSARGFQVIASHRPLQHSEVVEVDYGEQNSMLGGSGLSMIAFRTGPRLSVVPVRIKASGLESQFALAFSLAAI